MLLILNTLEAAKIQKKTKIWMIRDAVTIINTQLNKVNHD